MTQQPESDESIVAVTVVRSGGIAGMTRRWAVAAPPADPAPWLQLVDDCPWDAPASANAGADRFSYRVSARVRGTEHRADLSESDASGPWHALIAAVRAAATGGAPHVSHPHRPTASS